MNEGKACQLDQEPPRPNQERSVPVPFLFSSVFAQQQLERQQREIISGENDGIAEASG